MQLYPNSALIKADAWSVLMLWLALLSWLAAAIGILVVNPRLLEYWQHGIWVLVALTAIHIILALLHRCPSCGKHPTLQGFSTVHPGSKGQSRLGGWGGVVANVLRNNQFLCIHCGTAFKVKKAGDT